MSDPFDHAWKILKGEQKIGYDVRININSQMDAELFDQFHEDMAEAGIRYDWGMGQGGYDIHLDHSLKGATPEYVKEYLSQTGLDFTMTISVYEEDDPPKPKDYSHLPNPQSITDDPAGNAWIVGDAVTCPECGNPEAALIREGIEDGGHLNFACNMCGHMDSASDVFPGEGYE